MITFKSLEIKSSKIKSKTLQNCENNLFAYQSCFIINNNSYLFINNVFTKSLRMSYNYFDHIQYLPMSLSSIPTFLPAQIHAVSIPLPTPFPPVFMFSF